MTQVKGRTALVTGASSGIGRELATIHAARGGDLIIIARSGNALEELKEELERKYSVRITIMVKDLSVPAAAGEIYKEVREKGLAVDFLINNAGFGGLGKFHERPWEKDFAMINVNILALTALTRLFLPDFVKRGEGRILNVSSSAALMPGPLQAVYYATKAYVTSFSNALFEELKDTGVTVTALMPGATESRFGRVSGMDKTPAFDKTLSADLVALKGYEGMLKGRLNVKVLPPALKLALGFLPFIPPKRVLKIIRRMQEV